MRYREPRLPIRKSDCNKHRERVCAYIYRWIREGRPTTLTQAAWGAAHDVYRVAGLVFIDFNEHHQRMYLRDGYLDWFKKLVDEMTEHIRRAKDFADTGGKTQEGAGKQKVVDDRGVPAVG